MAHEIQFIGSYHGVVRNHDCPYYVPTGRLHQFIESNESWMESGMELHKLAFVDSFVELDREVSSVVVLANMETKALCGSEMPKYFFDYCSLTVHIRGIGGLVSVNTNGGLWFRIHCAAVSIFPSSVN